MNRNIIKTITTFGLTSILFVSNIVPVSATQLNRVIYKQSLDLVNYGSDATNAIASVSIATNSLISGYYLNSSLSGASIVDSHGNDVPFMPLSSGDWLLYVGEIDSSESLNNLIYYSQDNLHGYEVIFTNGNIIGATSIDLGAGNWEISFDGFWDDNMTNGYYIYLNENLYYKTDNDYKLGV